MPSVDLGEKEIEQDRLDRFVESNGTGDSKIRLWGRRLWMFLGLLAFFLAIPTWNESLGIYVRVFSDFYARVEQMDLDLLGYLNFFCIAWLLGTVTADGIRLNCLTKSHSTSLSFLTHLSARHSKTLSQLESVLGLVGRLASFVESNGKAQSVFTSYIMEDADLDSEVRLRILENLKDVYRSESPET